MLLISPLSNSVMVCRFDGLHLFVSPLTALLSSILFERSTQDSYPTRLEVKDVKDMKVFSWKSL